MDSIKTVEYKGYKIDVYYDEDAESPRTWDNLGKMLCLHGRYDLGDKHEHTSKSFSGWDAMRAYIEKVYRAAVIYPLYIYDHGGLRIGTHPWGCPYDSGQVGYIYATRKSILKEYGGKYLTKRKRAMAEKELRREVITYDDYLSGKVYGYEITTGNGETVDGCWGYYGDYDSSGLLKDAKERIDYIQSIRRNNGTRH